MPFEIFLACSTKKGVDAHALYLLSSKLDFEAVYDLIEMNDVYNSWVEAGRKNAEIEAKMRQQTQGHTP